MSRYIDADALIDDLYEHEFSNWCDKDEVSTLVNDAPSIDIVRCGECEYWRAYETWSECGLWAGDPYETAKTNADDFCSYGEREGE